MGIINPKKLKNCGCSHSKPKKMKAGGKVFKSHMMYDMETGKGVKAPTMAKHLELKKKGYGHTKPTKLKKGGSVKDACYHNILLFFTFVFSTFSNSARCIGTWKYFI